MMETPTDGTIVKLSDMPRAWWILYQWENVTEMQDKEPRYVYGGLRPIEDRKEAAENFDAVFTKAVE